MWFLSKIELKRGRDLKELAGAIPKNAYAEHQALWRLVGAEDGAARNFLYRREQIGHWPAYYILSSHEPDSSDGPWEIQTKPFAPKLVAGQRLGFALRANPVRTTKVSADPDDRRRKRHDVIMHAKRLERDDQPDPAHRRGQSQLVQDAGPRWLEERAEPAGFALEALHVDDYRQHRFVKRGQTQPIRFSTLDYQGILRVLDVDRFLATLQNGIGPAKAFGCGLLLVRRAS
jgi:CRISPR system Cascade subunit CasE